MFSSLLLKRFSLANLQKRSWLKQNCILQPLTKRKSIVTSLRKTPGLDPIGNAICHNFSFLMRRCTSAGFPLFPPQGPLGVVGRLGEKKESARGTIGRGKREERPFPSSHRPLGAFYFSVCTTIFLGYPAGAIAEEREFSAFPKNQHFQIQFLVLGIGRNS